MPRCCRQLIRHTASGSGLRQVRESAEPFHLLTVDVAAQYTLDNALRKFCVGERLEGYRWEEDDGAAAGAAATPEPVTTKRACIARLAPTLLLHLKARSRDQDRRASRTDRLP